MRNTYKIILFPLLVVFFAAAGAFFGWLVRSDKGYLEAALWLAIPSSLFVAMLMIVFLIVLLISRGMHQYWPYILFAFLLIAFSLAVSLSHC